MSDMWRKALIIICLMTLCIGARARKSLSRPYVDELRREWATMDTGRRSRKPVKNSVSENVRERFLDAYMLERQGRRQLAAGAYLEILDSLAATPELYIHANLALTDFYRGKPAYENAYAEYLLRAARAMAQTGQIDADTYIEIGNYLISKDFRQAGEQALKIAAVRKAEVGEHQSADQLIRIASAESSRRQVLVWSLVGLCSFIALAAIGFGLYYKRKRRREVIRGRRREDDFEAERDRRREINSNFIALALSGIEELKNFNTFVARKLTAGQAKALYADVESGTYLQGVSDKFFDEFDSAFLSSHPDFYDNVNALLKPDRRFAPADDGHLSPELRIAAFMMLGITDTAKLAMVMNLSVNTIYTYRNRLRSRAEDRDNFEARLAGLE